MLDKSLIPTPLVLEGNGGHPRPIEVEDPRRPSRSRPLFLLVLVGRWGLGLLGRRLIHRHLEPVEEARRFRVLLETIGGLWVKAGQFMALRHDIFPDEFCEELSLLHDSAKGFPGTIARRIVEESLGAPIDHLFSAFDDVPIAAASIGQVHQAVLRDGDVAVAVKVQRPWIAERFEQDLALIARLSALLHLFSILPFMRWPEFVVELTDVMQAEVDYYREASSIHRMRKVLRRHRIYAPKVFFDFSGARVLTMEFIEGVRLTQYIALQRTDPRRVADWTMENDFRPKRAARRLFFSLQRQCCEDNLFHGDLHPGNIILLRQGRIALIDFGTIGSLEASRQREHVRYIMFLASGEFQKAAEYLLLMMTCVPVRELDDLKARLVRVISSWSERTATRGLPYEQKSFSSVIGELGKILVAYGVAIEWSFMRMDRAHLSLDASLRVLFSNDVNYRKLIRRYLEGMRAREVKRAFSRRAVGAHLAGTVAAARQVPELVENLTQFQGRLLRDAAQVYRNTLTKAAYFFKVLFANLLVVELLAVVTALYGLLIQHSTAFAARVPGFVLELANELPRRSASVWVAIVAGCVYAFCLTWLLWRRIGQGDPVRLERLRT